MFVCDSITAILLFAQFSVVRSRAILIIASGYLFTALVLIPWILTFPGVFAPAGLLGGLQSTSWLYFFQHAGLPLFVIGYALFKDADSEKRVWQGTLRSAIVVQRRSTVALVSAVAVFLHRRRNVAAPRGARFAPSRPAVALCWWRPSPC